MLTIAEMLDHQSHGILRAVERSDKRRYRHAGFGDARTVERDRECVRQRALPQAPERRPRWRALEYTCALQTSSVRALRAL